MKSVQELYTNVITYYWEELKNIYSWTGKLNIFKGANYTKLKYSFIEILKKILNISIIIVVVVINHNINSNYYYLLAWKLADCFLN